MAMQSKPTAAKKMEFHETHDASSKTMVCGHNGGFTVRSQVLDSTDFHIKTRSIDISGFS